MNTPPDTAVRSVLPFRVLVDEAMRMTRRHGWAIYPWVAGPLVVVSVAMVLIQAVSMHSMMGAARQAEAGDPFAVIQPMLWLWGVAFLYGALFGLAAVATLGAATHSVAGGEVRMVFWWTWGLHPRRLATMVLVGLMVLAGTLMCVVPGMVVSVLAGLTVPVMVREDKWGVEAISRSFRLVRDNPERRFVTHPGVRLFAIGMIGSILSYVLTFAIQMPFMVVQWVMMFRSIGAAEDPTGIMTSPWYVALQVPQAVLSGLAQVAVILYLSFAVALFFDDLLRRREGGDLADVLDALESADATGAR